MNLWKNNSLSIVLTLVFMAIFAGQIFTGWHENNYERIDKGAPPLSLSEYLGSGHFLETTFENWESEFLQMSAYVLLTIGLRQKGSSESKPVGETTEVDREPDPAREGAPWPVRKGGFTLMLYKNSLSLALALLFVISFVLHAIGSLDEFNETQLLDGKAGVNMQQYLGMSRFWFESFQNWQSEFIAVLSIVVLSIFLRQKGSPESKPVDASNNDTGE